MRSIVIASVCVLLCFGAAYAQSDRGTITGTISDPAGAMIPNAPIEAKNLDTGAVFQVASSATGNYTIAQLPVGVYQLSASVTGFKQYVRTGITVMVAQTLRIDIPLEVGSISETVTVSADAPLLKTESGELAHNVSSSRLDDLPVLSAGGMRNSYEVVNLIPGGMTLNVPGAIFGALRVNGMPAGTLALRIEGQDATQTTWSAAYGMSQPSVDSIEETAVQTSNFAAEFGQVGGGMFNMTMKSGTNELHGTAFEYLRNETMFNAHQPFSHYRPRDRRHDWGFSVGGPVYLPKLYDGRDKTFFYFSFERNNPKSGVSDMYTIPATGYRIGDFSHPSLYTGKVLGTDILGRPIMDGAIYDPLTTRTEIVDGKSYVVRDPFPNNIIPPGYPLDPVAVKLQSYLPATTNSAATNNYARNYTNQNLNSIYSIKMDHNLSAKMKISGYWSMNDTFAGFPDGFPPPVTTERDLWETAHTTRVNFDYTISPTVLLHLGGGFLHFTFWDPTPGFGNWDNLKELGMPGTVTGVYPTIYNIYQAQGGGFKDATNQFNSMGPVAQQKQWQQKPTGTANLNWVKGNHTYKFGAEFRVESYPSIATTPSNGWFFFGPAQTALPYLNRTSIGGGNIGFGYASFLLGQVDHGENGQQSIFHIGKHSFALFAQDSWKVTRKLTMDYGLRYDYQTYLKGDGRIPSFGYDTPNPAYGNLPGAQIFEGRDVENFATNYPYSFGPRLGIAYQLTPKTVLRGGIGVSYGQTAQLEMWTLRFGSDVRYGPATTYGTAFSLLKDGPPGGVPAWPNYDPGFQPQSPGAVFMTSVDRHSGYPPRQLMWSLGVQRELSKDMSIEASYVGNRGVWWNASGTLTDPNRVTPAILAQHNLSVGNVDDGSLLISQFETVPDDVKAAHNLVAPYAGFRGTVSQSLRPYPQFGSIFVLWAPLGNTWYDSLQIKFTKRYSHGLDMQASYVWSKETTVGAESQDQAFQVVPAIYNLNDLRSNKSLSLSSIPHRFVLTATYLTPNWASAPHRALSYTLKDWRIGAYMVYQSGLPITAPVAAFQQYNVAQTLSLCAPFSVLGGCNTSAFYSAPAGYSPRVAGQPLYTQDINDKYNPQKTFILNPNAWETPAPATFSTGSAAYNDYRYRRAPNETFSLERIFRFRESMSLNIRVELSNAFNRTRIAMPFNSMLLPQVTDSSGNATSGFGYSSNWQNAGGQRTGQLVMRFSF